MVLRYQDGMIKVHDRAALRLSRETTETPERSMVIGLGESNKVAYESSCSRGVMWRKVVVT
jgi:hypothetical protein